MAMARHVIGSLLVLFLECGEGLFFELKPGAQGECFKAKPGKSHRLVGSFEADGPREGVVVKLTDPSEKQLWHSQESSARFDIEVEDEGSHMLCFGSTVSESQVVSFHFRVEEEQLGEGQILDASKGSDAHHQFVTKEHTDKVGELVQKLEYKAADILDQQQYAITREAVHRETAESTNSRVMWWTLAEVVVLVTLALFQVYYLKAFFEVKQSI
mmetsp:Transcript_27545/g.53974  ORF Transcript_27545/g.53974 Transcript_27545/m.53974 type:complete len:214 (+) Transcript_27545:44-685(+)